MFKKKPLDVLGCASISQNLKLLHIQSPQVA